MVNYLAVWLIPQFTFRITQDKNTSKNVVVLGVYIYIYGGGVYK